MLTKKDLEQIENVVANKIDTAFADFYEHIFEPFSTRNEMHHQEMVREIKSLKKDVSGLQEETTEIKEYIKDHDKRIDKLEVAVSIKN